MRVYLAENASQGNDLASVLDPGYQREDGYISLDNGDYVTRLAISSTAHEVVNIGRILTPTVNLICFSHRTSTM